MQPTSTPHSHGRELDISLADPNFGNPSKVDLLLGVEVFAEIMMQGRRTGPPGSPIAFETKFGWVLAGGVDSYASVDHVVTHHVSVFTGDDILRKFWKIEEQPLTQPALSPEERVVVQHFHAEHSRTSSGRFIVPLPKKLDAKPIGASQMLTWRSPHIVYSTFPYTSSARSQAPRPKSGLFLMHLPSRRQVSH